MRTRCRPERRARTAADKPLADPPTTTRSYRVESFSAVGSVESAMGAPTYAQPSSFRKPSSIPARRPTQIRPTRIAPRQRWQHPSAMDAHGGGGIHLTVAAERGHVEIQAGVASGDLERLGIVVVAAFDRLNELRHHVPGDPGVLELVATGADGNVEAVEVGAVVDRDPVVAFVVTIDHALLLVRQGHAERRHPLVDPHRVGLPTITCHQHKVLLA